MSTGSPHIIISGWGSTGDVTPLIAVGATLRRRGYAVDVVANPHFEQPATAAGLTFRGVGEAGDHEALLADPGIFGAERRSWARIYADHYFPRMGAFYAAASAAMRPGTVAVLGDEVGAVAAAEQHGVPRVRLAPSSPRFASRYDPPHPGWILPRWSAWCAKSGARLAMLYRLRNLRRGIVRWPAPPAASPAALDAIVRFRTGHGLAPEPRPAALMICLWPEWFAPPQRDWPANAVIAGFPMYPPPIEPPADRVAVERPIVATTGSVAGSQAAFFEKVVEACRMLRKPAVLVSPHADHIPSKLPPGIRYVAHAPFNVLLGEASLVIHHGGIGTSAYALGAGIPQIVVPMRGDQFDNGNRLVRLGVAQMIAGARTTAAGLARIVDALLTSPRVAQRCRHWQAQLDPDEGLRRAADYIEALGFAAERRAMKS